MKLRTKLGLLMAAIFAASFLIWAFLLNHFFRDYTLNLLSENQREKLAFAQNAFRQVGTKEEFEKMGEIARDAYLTYQFEKVYGDSCALIKEGSSIANPTIYEIYDLAAMKESSMVQEVAGRQVLLVRMPLEYPSGFEVLSFQDITLQWQEMKRQLTWYAAAGTVIFLAAQLALSLLGKRLLISLKELLEAALGISRGEYGRMVKVRSRDEIGQVAAAFNQMSGTVKQQVEDLQLLLGAVAHEMKTPVTSIMGYSDSLLHVRLPKEDAAKSLRRIYDSAQRMDKMCGKLLSLVGMYENEAIERSPVSLSQILGRVKDQAGELLAKDHLTLEISCPEDMFLMGDELLLETLFFNLVQNSVRASKPGGRIEIAADREKAAVMDFGCGIPAKDLENVIKPFYMADRSRSRSQGGSGLGLALCERIVSLHGGTMFIESEEGKWTRVTVIYKTFTSC